MGATLQRRTQCFACNDGAVIPKWVNLTKVRPSNDAGAPGAPNYTCTPYLRYDPTDYDAENGTGACDGITTGCEKCGFWLVGGGSNALAAQEIDDTVDDIMACAADDATHKTVDKNCYEQSGTVDMRQGERRGGQWILASRLHHGRLPFKSANANNDDCDGVVPRQVRYTKIKRHLEVKFVGPGGTGSAEWGYFTNQIYDQCWAESKDPEDPHIYRDYERKTSSNFSFIQKATFKVDPLSGVITRSDAAHEITGTNSYEATGVAAEGLGWWDFYETGNFVYDYDANIVVDPLGLNWQRGEAEGVVLCPSTPSNYTWGIDPEVSPLSNAVARVQNFSEVLLPLDSICESIITSSPSLPGPTDWQSVLDYVESLGVSGTNTFQVTSQSYTDTAMEIEAECIFADPKPNPIPALSYFYWGSGKCVMKLSIVLSEPNIAAEVYQDWLELFRHWDMSDFSLAHLREDELLASAPLVMRDEKQAITNPDVQFYDKVPDYQTGEGVDSEGRNPGDPGYVPTQAQMDWFDPDAYKWRYSNNSVNTSNPDGNGIVSNAVLEGPTYTGEIIAHNQAGSERHFWFGFYDMERRADDCGAGASDFIWLHNGMGGFSPTELPAVTLRWQNRSEAQYDCGPFCNPAASCGLGNYPQAFINQVGGSIIGGKYVEAAFLWPSVNYGRPAGKDRYAVDQTTVCAVKSGSCTSGTVNVRVTAGVPNPGTTGGLAVNDYIASDGEGFYKISGITDEGVADWDSNGDSYRRFAITVGAKIEDLPTGWVMKSAPRDDTYTPAGSYIGKLRWVNFTKNSVSFTMPSPIAGRAACTTSYAAGAVTVTFSAAQPYLRKDVTDGKIVVDLWNAAHTVKVAAAVELTRVSDTVFTYAAGSDPVAAWATGKDYTWTDYDETPQRTGIFLDYRFDIRAINKPSPPPWYDGVAGCLSCTKTQFTYPVDKCRAMVGFVPHYSPIPNPAAIPNPSGTPPANEPVENFSNQVLADFPATFRFDYYGAHWQGQVCMAMPDPFWQIPFTPDAGVNYGAGDTMAMEQDDGSGQSSSQVVGVSNTDYTVIYAHPRWVEAAKNIPTGNYLPAVLSLFYANDIAPAYFLTDGGATSFLSGGIPIGDDEGNYASVETVYGFRNRAKANIAGNFSSYYAEFVP